MDSLFKNSIRDEMLEKGERPGKSGALRLGMVSRADKVG